MAGLNSVHTLLKNIHDQVSSLTTAVISLNESFETESVRLTRQEAAQRLKAIRAAIEAKLEQVRCMERAASNGHDTADMFLSLSGLAAKFITKTATNDRRTQKLVNSVFNTNTYDNPPYGKVMVCIGSKGLPDDVRVISISELARESNRLESDVITTLKNQGFLLLSEKAFCSLIEDLVEGVQEGCMVLPVPIEKVAELMTSSRPEWRPVKPS